MREEKTQATVQDNFAQELPPQRRTPFNSYKLLSHVHR
jgi:hypothetical protein